MSIVEEHILSVKVSRHSDITDNDITDETWLTNHFNYFLIGRGQTYT